MLLLLAAGPLRAQPAPQPAQGLDAGVIAQVQQMAQLAASAAAPPQARVDVQVGQLAPQLKLAACRQVQPYLPQGLHMWGRTRIGLKCVDGMAKWNVSVPVQVRVFARALVAQKPLPAGTVLAQDSLAAAEIDIAGEPGAVFTDATELAGRTLARPLDAGQAVRSPALQRRQWFAAGETVQVRVAGEGYAVAAEGQAMSAGLEGQDVKVRMEGGRTVTGRVVGERRVEILL
ncbi:flagellar basal body P-ring formation chaperone FlgA [Pelomonas sp. KK5]|uniref:flagellar basal body P-ring formation chaperone FlgA n=1 Tax=Pelomonas sp. KK5 TaxID=1855730 RepID=UPI001301EBA8|nr:flagellar basal body P-ring formation chaperone FlgA [Pelomonas sp. KK5]